MLPLRVVAPIIAIDLGLNMPSSVFTAVLPPVIAAVVGYRTIPHDAAKYSLLCNYEDWATAAPGTRERLLF
jgi:hypothetical protein